MFNLMVKHKRKRFEIRIWYLENHLPYDLWIGECVDYPIYRKHGDNPLDVFSQLLDLINTRNKT